MAIRYVAFLRGINVGGKCILPMKDLKQIFSDAGCHSISTYIQSGNVVFSAAAKTMRALDKRVTADIKERFGHTTRVVIRDIAQMQAVVDGNPYLSKCADPAKMHVVFLADLPEAPSELDPMRSPPDEFCVVGQDIYLHVPNGAADTKLTNAYFDSKLKTVSTGRNWRTVTKMLEMLKAV